MVHRAASTDPDAASPLVTIGESTAAASMSAATTFLTGPPPFSLSQRFQP